MTPSDRFETLIAGWLSTEALARAPRGTLDAVLDRTRSVRPMAGWRARILVPPMRRDSTILVGAPLARRAAVAAALALVALTATLLVAGALVLRSQLSKMDLFVYVADPISLPTAFCAEVHDCRNGLSGWPGGRFVLVQEAGATEPRVLVEAPWPSTIFDLRVAPDGTRLAYARTQVGFPGTCLQLVTFDLATGEETLVAEIAGAWAWAVEPQPGGRERLLFSASGRCSPGGVGIFAYDPEDRSTTLAFDLVDVLGQVTDPPFGRTVVGILAVHPDGRRVLMSVHRSWGQADTYIVAIDGTSPPETVGCDCTGAGGSWSPDGASILVEEGFGALRIGRGDLLQFRTVADLADSPSWSPDGSAVAYLGPAADTGDRRYNRGIYVVDAADGEPVRIAGVRLPYSTITTPPRWSPSGEWIYWSDMDGTWAIRPDGTERRQMVLPAQVDLRWVSVEAR